MNNTLLAVDKNIEHFNRQRPIWKNHGIELERADNMPAAIDKLTKNDYIAVGINADNILDYMDYLQLVRNLTASPIHVITSNFEARERILAFRNGADAYSVWLSNLNDNVEAGVVMFDRHHQRIHEPKSKSAFLSESGVLICLEHYRVYVDGKEIELRGKEYEILRYLMANCGRVMSYDQIYRDVWGEEYVEELHNTLHTQVKRLRQKLCGENHVNEYIENVRRVGYRFLRQAILINK